MKAVPIRGKADDGNGETAETLETYKFTGQWRTAVANQWFSMTAEPNKPRR